NDLRTRQTIASSAKHGSPGAPGKTRPSPQSAARKLVPGAARQPDRAVPADPPGAVSSQTMRVGIVGSGLMGGKLGTLFARAGHEVVFSYARSEQKLSELARTFPAKCCLPSSKPSANSPDPASCTAGTTLGARGSPPG